MNGHFASVDICSLSFGLRVADITYVPTWAGLLWLAIVFDASDPARHAGPWNRFSGLSLLDRRRMRDGG
jgi:hypothetical protein